METCRTYGGHISRLVLLSWDTILSVAANCFSKELAIIKLPQERADEPRYRWVRPPGARFAAAQLRFGKRRYGVTPLVFESSSLEAGTKHDHTYRALQAVATAGACCGRQASAKRSGRYFRHGGRSTIA